MLLFLRLRWTMYVERGNKNSRWVSAVPGEVPGAQGTDELVSYLPTSAAGSIWGSFLHKCLLKHLACSVLPVRSRRLQPDHPPVLSLLVIMRLLERAARRASPAAPQFPTASLLERSTGRRNLTVCIWQWQRLAQGSSRICSTVGGPKTRLELDRRGRGEERLPNAARGKLRFVEVLCIHCNVRWLRVRQGDPSGPPHAGVRTILQSKPRCFREAAGPGHKTTSCLQTNSAHFCWGSVGSFGAGSLTLLLRTLRMTLCFAVCLPE